MIIALITKRNNPSVIMVAGSVKNIKIGFTNKRKNPKVIATKTAERKSLTSTPGNILDKMITPIAVIKIFNISFILYFLVNFLFRENY